MDVCSALVVVMSVQVVGLGCCAGVWACRRGRVVQTSRWVEGVYKLAGWGV